MSDVAQAAGAETRAMDRIVTLTTSACVGALVGLIGMIAGWQAPYAWTVALGCAAAFLVLRVLAMMGLAALKRRREAATARWAARPLKRTRAAAPWPVAIAGGLAVLSVWAMAVANLSLHAFRRLENTAAPNAAPPLTLLEIIADGLIVSVLAAVAALIAVWLARPWMAARAGRISPPRWARRVAVLVFHATVIAGWTVLVFFGTVFSLAVFAAVVWPLSVTGRYYRVWEAQRVMHTAEGLDELQKRARDAARSRAYGAVFVTGLALVAVMIAPWWDLTWQAKLFAALIWVQLYFALPEAILTWNEPDHAWAEVDDDGV